MKCIKCVRKFTRINRREMKCGKCCARTCSTCIKSDFNQHSYSLCNACRRYFFDHPTVTERQLDTIYERIATVDDEKPKVFAMMSVAVTKLPKIKHRIRCLDKHVRKYPDDTYVNDLLGREIRLYKQIKSILFDSELLPCIDCGGQTTVHDSDLQYQAMYTVLMMYESCIPNNLPHTFVQMLQQDFVRHCTTCNRIDTTTLKPNDRWFCERRCPSCNFLIQFYQKHNGIRLLCCPKCKSFTSRWGHGRPTDDTVADMYLTFFTHSCILVNQDIRG